MTQSTIRKVRKVKPVRSRVGLGVVAVLAVAVAVFSVYLYSANTLAQLAEQDAGLGSTYAVAPRWVQVVFYIHVGTGSLALLIGPAQFARKLRSRAPRVHRLVGRAYLASVAVGAVSALLIVPFSRAGFVALFGFGMLSLLWLGTGARALAAIRRRDIASHQAWMMRNYALTFAAPTLRLWLAALITVQMFAVPGTDLGAAYTNAYAAVPFLCWIPNLVVAEWLIRRRGLPSYRLADDTARRGVVEHA